VTGSDRVKSDEKVIGINERSGNWLPVAGPKYASLLDSFPVWFGGNITPLALLLPCYIWISECWESKLPENSKGGPIAPGHAP